MKLSVPTSTVLKTPMSSLKMVHTKESIEVVTAMQVKSLQPRKHLVRQVNSVRFMQHIFKHFHAKTFLSTGDTAMNGSSNRRFGKVTKPVSIIAITYPILSTDLCVA